MRKSLKIILPLVALAVLASFFIPAPQKYEDEALDPEFNKIFVLPKVADEDNIFVALRDLEGKVDEKLANYNLDDLLAMSDAEIATLLDDNKELLQEYFQIYKKKRYVQTSIEQTQAFWRLNNLIRMAIIQKTRNGEYSAALDLWAENMAFQQKIISDYPSFVIASVILVSYKVNLELLKSLFPKDKLNEAQKEKIKAILSFKFADDKNGLSIAKAMVVEYYSIVKVLFKKDQIYDLSNNNEWQKAFFQNISEDYKELIKNKDIVYLPNNTKNLFLKGAQRSKKLYALEAEKIDIEVKAADAKCHSDIDSEVKEKKVFFIGKNLFCNISMGASLIPSLLKMDSESTLCEMGLKECAPNPSNDGAN